MRRSLSSLALAACTAHHAAPTAAPCDPAADVVLAAQDDVTAFATCTEVASLAIRTGGALGTAALHLQTIRGDLVIGPTVSVEEIALPEVRSVGGAIRVVGNGSLHGLFLPRLERAQRIDIEGNVSLANVSMPRLATVTGALTIAESADLELVELSALTDVGDLTVTGAPKLTLFEAERLTHAASVRVEDVPMLPAEVADKLRAAVSSP